MWHVSIWPRAALLQNGQPVAYASRALSAAETRYAKIEKDLLEIVIACERFHPYVYCCDMIRVEIDYKPLQSIILKPLIYSASKWHERMRLRLQKYSLNVAYKKGKEMYMANTRVEPSFQWVLKACNRSNMRQPMNQYYSYSVQPYAVHWQKANQKFQISSSLTTTRVKC